MKKISLQFHGTTKDIYDFVFSYLENHSYNIYGVVIFSRFIIENISMDSTIYDFKRYDMIIFSKDEINICDNYKDFICEQDNNLCITVGYNDDNILKEFVMWTKNDNEIDNDWKKIITKYKKQLLKGAWVVNPNNKNRTYYKNHRYTADAKQAYEQGTIICPIAGWNVYELTNDELVSE